MRLSFLNGLILGTILGAGVLAAVSVSNDVAGLKGLKPGALIVPLSKAPDILVNTTIVISESDRRPDVMLLASINVRFPKPLTLGLSARSTNEY